jgi:hypothetical protein
MTRAQVANGGHGLRSDACYKLGQGGQGPLWAAELLMMTEVAQSVQCLTTDCTIEVRYAEEAKDFSSSLHVETSSEAHPASYPMGNGGVSPGVKRGRGVTMTTHPI